MIPKYTIRNYYESVSHVQGHYDNNHIRIRTDLALLLLGIK